METTTATIDDLRFPIGKFDSKSEITAAERAQFIEALRNLPESIAKAVEGLTDEQLDTPYRPEGWTLRQTVHHVADSHLNSFCRFKLAMTEDAPTIRPYFEERWAELADSKLPVEISLTIIEGVHKRMVALFESMSDEEFQREMIHPDSGRWTIEKMLGLYAWHGAHHTAHITRLRELEGWRSNL